MINLVFEDGIELKEKEKKYLIGTLDGRIHESDELHELVAVICGMEYLDCECAETEWHMRTNAAKRIGLMTMTAEEMGQGFGSSDDEDILETETIIIYDERIGKIPYSYTDPIVDYEIHGEPELIRVECDKTFLYSLEKDRLISVFEKVEGDYQRWLNTKDLDALIEEELLAFREASKKFGRVPLHKKIGE